MENSQAKYVLTIGLFLENIRQACEIYDGIEKIIVLGMDDKPDDVLGFIEMVLYEDGSLYDVDREFDVHNDIVVLPYSSGTTGPPKGIKKIHIFLSEIGGWGQILARIEPSTSKGLGLLCTCSGRYSYLPTSMYLVITEQLLELFLI